MKTITLTQNLRRLSPGNTLGLSLKAALVLLLLGAPVYAGKKGRGPELPLPICEEIQPEGQRLILRIYATGVQIYRWDGSAWLFEGPEAGLYADPGYHGLIGIHYAGPTWEAKDGSAVRGSVTARCLPDPDAIPWLLLAATPLDQPGLFSRVTSIQRINTAGGVVPEYSGTSIGEEARVPYTAEYFFYIGPNGSR